MPIFPNVPNAPGVPAVPRPPGVAGASLSLLVNDAVSFILTNLYAFQWGIFQNGLPIIVPNSIVSLDYKQDWSISSYPVEQGQFLSYDKVATPFEARVRMASGTSLLQRSGLLEGIQAIAGTLALYDVVTPEITYESVNIHHYDYQRTSTNGAGIIVVDVWLTQVIQVSTTSFSNTQQPSGANPTSGGSVQAKTPPANLSNVPLLAN